MTGSVTRTEIAEAVRAAFGRGPVDRSHLVDTATSSGARTEVVELLAGIPLGPYRRLQDLWIDLADVPVGA